MNSRGELPFDQLVETKEFLEDALADTQSDPQSTHYPQHGAGSNGEAMASGVDNRNNDGLSLSTDMVRGAQMLPDMGGVPSLNGLNVGGHGQERKSIHSIRSYCTH